MVVVILLMAAPFVVFGQPESHSSLPVVDAGSTAPPDSISVPMADYADDTLLTPTDSLELLEPPLLISKTDNYLGSKTDSHLLRARRQHKLFTPNPQRALWLSFVIPCGGQVYNRKYWKLPVFIGGFLGCMYAFTWNQQMYMDYSQAYLDIMDDNPDTNSYLSMFPPTYDIESNVNRFQTMFKNRKDRFRRWRDLSAFCFVAVYGLSIIDAYVDAHLSVFDISPDLSFQWSPTSIEGPHPNIGISAALNF